MIDITALKKQEKIDFRNSLRIIDLYVQWIKKTPNEIWSKQQADLYRLFYQSVNADWRKSQAKSKS